MHYARHLDGSGQAGPQFSHNRLPYHHKSNFLHTHVLDAPEQCATARVGGSGGGVRVQMLLLLLVVSHSSLPAPFSLFLSVSVAFTFPLSSYPSLSPFPSS